VRAAVEAARFACAPTAADGNESGTWGNVAPKPTARTIHARISARALVFGRVRRVPRVRGGPSVAPLGIHGSTPEERREETPASEA